MSKTNNFLKPSVGKLKLWSLVTALVVALGVVFLAVFGYSTNATNDDVNTLTVKANQYAYTQRVEDIENITEAVFSELGISYKYDMKGTMNGDESEIVYVFDVDVDLAAAKTSLDKKFAAVTAPDSQSTLSGAFVSVSVNSEKALDRLPGEGLLRTVIAAVGFAVLACLYLAVRHHYASGVTLFVSIGVGAALTSALVLITRMPITGNLLFTLFFNLLFTATCTTFTLNKVRKAQKADKKLDAQTLIENNVAYGEVTTFAVATAVALVLVGAVATSAVRWFAAISLLSVVAGVFASIFFAPAFYLVVKKFADSKTAQRERYDYKKGVKNAQN